MATQLLGSAVGCLAQSLQTALFNVVVERLKLQYHLSTSILCGKLGLCMVILTGIIVFHVFPMKYKVAILYLCHCFCCSMFVLLKGRSREEAFRIGKEIASSITAINPDPVTLKFEKVYQPCFLLTKKRYVGYSYESPEQNEPIFDAKGIETVRRDTCPAVAKILERSIRIMFEEQDLTKVSSVFLLATITLSLLQGLFSFFLCCFC